MKTSDLVFIGIKGSVLALDRWTGNQVWAVRLKGSDFVNVVVQEDEILATCAGEVFCLDPLTGRGRWRNALKGFGTGLATIATEQKPNGLNAAISAEKQRRDQQAEAAGSASTAGAGTTS
jgi:outer membrane protein assembly factor BamB